MKEDILSPYTLKANIKKAFYNQETKDLTISGDYIPEQTIKNISWNEWQCAVDIEGRKALDVEIYKEDENEFGIQFVSLKESETTGTLTALSNHQGISTNSRWHDEAIFEVFRVNETETSNPENVLRVCEQCGSENVSFSAWVNYNTGESNQVGHDYIGSWCFDGCEETRVMYQDDYLSEIHPVFECTIEWDDGSTQEVLICTFDNCPEKYDDDEIFFYGFRYSEMVKAIKSDTYFDGWD